MKSTKKPSGISLDPIIDNQKDYWDSVSSCKTFTHPLEKEKFQFYVSKVAKILDFGCGYGRTCDELYNLGYLKITGVDSSKKMVERGLNDFPHLCLETCEGGALPFESNTFDAIILFAVLTCIPTNDGQQALIKELHRILRPGGIIYISDYWLQIDERNLERYSEFEAKFGQYGVFELPEGAIVRHHSKEWISTLLKDFKLLDMFDCEFTTMNGNQSSCFQFFGSFVA